MRRKQSRLTRKQQCWALLRANWADGGARVRVYRCISIPAVIRLFFSFFSFMETTAPELNIPTLPVRGTNLYVRKRRHAIRYPKNFDPSRTTLTVPDPHRWLPRSQRPGQARRRANPASYIRGPQGLVSSEERKSTGPSTAHIDLGNSAPTTRKKKK